MRDEAIQELACLFLMKENGRATEERASLVKCGDILLGCSVRREGDL